MSSPQTNSSSAELSVVCLNTYLIPEGWVEEYTKTCINQDQRAVAMAEFCADKDVVCLQEVWGSQVSILQTKFENSHSLLHRNKSCSRSWWLAWVDRITGCCAHTLSEPSSPPSMWSKISQQKESFASLLDCGFFWLQANGGLWFSAAKSLHSSESPIVGSGTHSYLTGTWKMRLGVQATLVDVTSKKWRSDDKKVYVLFFNTHLHFEDTYNRTEARTSQLREMVQFFRDIVLRNRLNLPFFSELNWKEQCAVVICGDFNTSYLTPQYEDITKVYFPGARDLYCELHPQVGLDGQHTYDPENSYVNFPDQPSRIDYIFLIDKLPPEASCDLPIHSDKMEEHQQAIQQKEEKDSIEFLRLKCSRLDIMKQPKGKEYSDHWPLLAHLSPF
eukprot:TRINITY_DN7875_c0_g1_i1.p1 TRINITY_DN7875_c0_g1~~TRINITY_DN7875_c0_g1_i1.p1  ORF type:complete len:388 (-),score=99.21 TRINITY_DN7875_c0_g1_i1:68-1231(-)